MYFGFVCFYCLLKLLCLVNSLNDHGCGKLLFVTLVFRHGDRAPDAPYPTDPHSDVSCWPNGWGQLTRLGKLQQYELGQWIRRRYWDFLPSKYNASDIYVRSTDVDRTLMSAYCNLAGLYESGWSEEDNDGLAWQPVPVHTTPLHADSVLAARKKCPAYEKLLRDAAHIDEVRQANEFFKEAFCNLSLHAGLPITSAKDCLFLYSTLFIENLHGFKLPAWTEDYFPQPLKEMAEMAFKLPCYTTPMKRLKCGPLLKEIVQHMQARKEGKISQRMWMYSGHDTTVANLMQCLGVFDDEPPPFTATLILELHQRQQGHYVSIFYKTPTSFKTLKLPACEKLCPFHEFQRTVGPVIPGDWEAECAKP